MGRKAGDRLRERLGGDEYDRIKEKGLQGGISTEGFDSSKKRYSAAEVTAELRNRGDRSVNDGEGSMQEYFQGLVDDGSRFNNKARAKLEGIGVTFGGGGDKPDGGAEEPDASIPKTPDNTPTPTPTPNPSPSPGPSIPTMPPGLTYPGSQTQIVNQDNDITSNVTGNNNTVTNTQDNSVNQYGSYGTADRAKMLRDRYVADVSRFVRA